MDKKFIDAEMLIAELEASCMPIHEKGISGILGDNESIADVIRAQPAADVQEVTHGEWCGTVCSNCTASISDYYDCDYCPRCGARMDGEENDL